MENLERELFELQDVEYRDFHAKLMPNIEKDRIIGIRTPVLRKFAKEFSSREESKSFLNLLPHYYYEENNLHAFLISNMKEDFDVVIEYVEKFLPYINNWATCDMFSPKIFKKYPKEVYEKILIWITSNDTYTVRFGVVTLLQFYLDDNYDRKILEIVGEIKNDEYYVKMAIAWFYSFVFIKHYDDAIEFFQKRKLDKWVHNKAIQKAIESYRINNEQKDRLRKLKIKIKNDKKIKKSI